MAADESSVADPEALFAELERALSNQRLPPVDRWHPERQGRVDIRIARDGTWYHEGGAIRRSALVKLLSGVLRRDADGHVLVTPAERLLIEVEETPFVAVDCEVRGRGRSSDLIFTTNTGDLVCADAAHPIVVKQSDRGPRPLVVVRGEAANGWLLARILPSVYYRLVEHGVSEGGHLWLCSRGAAFDLGALG